MPSFLLSTLLLLLSSSSLTHAAPVPSGSQKATKYGRVLGKRHGVNLNIVNKRSEGGPELGGTDFPDPSITFVDNTWYAFATGGNGKNIQMASSADFNTWNVIDGDALPDLSAATWVDQGGPATWAPDIVQVVSPRTMVTRRSFSPFALG